MSKRDVLNLLRECVVDSIETHTWTEEEPDGYYRGRNFEYIDANKMLAAIDARFEKMNSRAKSRRKALTPSAAPSPG